MFNIINKLRTENSRVVGSIPTLATIFFALKTPLKH